ncbi:TRAP transporter small permease subunit [Marivibrio halodurans]|uniref:TRAP transporter small permease protein n=1 Tax=Marivibrio halodurans TaxID=2039722 RepID=A0A8J7RXG6_9PROT|nr:TRAP transporter small permease subunit [Marivibrio halodurans]MBP5856210.1 TRAP transporter small permease subunit [Marivibrio halodurans]
MIRLIDGINEAVGRVISWVAVVFAAMIIYDVVMRYVFSAPTLWAFDLTRQLYGFYFIMLGGYALRHGSHVKVDILSERLAPLGQRILAVLGYLIFFFPFAWVFTTRSYDFAMRSWQQGETTYGAAQLPVYPVKMAMAVAAALLIIQGISEVMKLVLARGQSEGEAGHVG